MLLLVIAMLLLLIVLMVAAPRWDEDKFLLAIGAGAIVAHMQFAATGWLFRYEAYLVVLALSVAGVIAAAWADRVSALMPDGARLPRYAVLCALVVVFGFPFASRGLSALRTAPVATSNIFEQQYQMGLFLDRFYRDRHVAVNDIGAVAYLADVRLLDLYGLATLETARLHRRGAYSPDAVSTLAAERDTAVAIIYPSWFGEYGGVPPQWTRVGDWKVRDNVILGDSVVSFYAVKPDERAPLAANLRQFAADLPADVSQSGEYRVAAGSK
jgi:hypothetical protein